jgi:hypothetical protein
MLSRRDGSGSDPARLPIRPPSFRLISRPADIKAGRYQGRRISRPTGMWAGGYQSRPKSEATEILTNSLSLPAGRIRFQPPDGIGRPNPKKRGGTSRPRPRSSTVDPSSRRPPESPHDQNHHMICRTVIPPRGRKIFGPQPSFRAMHPGPSCAFRLDLYIPSGSVHPARAMHSGRRTSPASSLRRRISGSRIRQDPSESPASENPASESPASESPPSKSPRASKAHDTDRPGRKSIGLGVILWRCSMLSRQSSRTCRDCHRARA